MREAQIAKKVKRHLRQEAQECLTGAERIETAPQGPWCLPGSGNQRAAAALRREAAQLEAQALRYGRPVPAPVTRSHARPRARRPVRRRTSSSRGSTDSEADGPGRARQRSTQVAP